MIEFKLKAKNCNRGQLLRSAWVSSIRCSSNKLEQRDWEPIVYDDETQIQMFADWSMSYAKRVIGKNPEYHFVVAIRGLLSHCSTVIGLMLTNDRLKASTSSSTEQRVNYSQVKAAQVILYIDYFKMYFLSCKHLHLFCPFPD